MPNQSELEFQLENWNHFNWLSGGPICEQQIHNLDVINWVLGGIQLRRKDKVAGIRGQIPLSAMLLIIIS